MRRKIDEINVIEQVNVKVCHIRSILPLYERQGVAMNKGTHLFKQSFLCKYGKLKIKYYFPLGEKKINSIFFQPSQSSLNCATHFSNSNEVKQEQTFHKTADRLREGDVGRQENEKRKKKKQ